MLPKNKERPQKKSPEKCQNLSKEKREKSDNMVANNKEISLKMKSKGCLSIRKIL